MATKTSDESPTGAVADVREKGAELVSAAQEQVGAKAEEMRGEAAFQLREQVEQRSTQAAEQVRSLGSALRPGVEQLRSEGKGATADVVDKVARRADDLGGYLESANADQILGDIESFARRRPWLTAGAAALAGFVASRLVKASSQRRYDQGHGNAVSHSTQPGLPAGAAE
jgi:hypothetical protein